MRMFIATVLTVLIYSVKGQNYSITSVLENPYLIYNGDGTFSGFMVDILDELSRSGGFSYSLHVTPDGQYGTNFGGTWNGMIGEIVNKTSGVDIAAGPLTITEERKAVVSFSKPFETISFRMLIKKPAVKVQSLDVLFQPFSLPLWIMVIVICFVISAMLVIINKFSPSEWSKVKPEDDPTFARDSFSTNNIFFFVHSTLTWQGYKEIPRSPAGRILVTMWFSFIFFMVLAYSANLTAFLMTRTEKPVIPFKSWEEMVAQNSVTYGYKLSETNVRLMRGTNDQTVKRIERNVENNYSYFQSYEKAVKKVRESDGRFAAIIPGNIGLRFARQEPCDLLMFGARILSFSNAFACKSEKVCDYLSRGLLLMHDKGTFELLSRKWFGDTKEKCPKTDLDEYISKSETAHLTARPLSIADVSLAFVVLLMGIVGSIVFLAVEILINRRRGKTNSGENKMASDNDLERAKLTDGQKEVPQNETQTL